MNATTSIVAPSFCSAMFADVKGATAKAGPASWQELIDQGKSPATYARKSDCPLIKLATFGESRTPKGSLRHDGNITAVYGVEIDYDAGKLTPTELADRLRAADVQALVVTTPSHNQAGKGSRARIFAPLSEPCAPAERAHFVGVLNAILGGVAAPESFTLSQTYYFGRVAGVDYEAIHVDGSMCVDILGLLIAPVGPDTAVTAERGEKPLPAKTSDPLMGPSVDLTPAQFEQACRAVDWSAPRSKWFERLAAMHDYYRGSAKGLALAIELSATGSNFAGPDDVRERWDSLTLDKPDGITAKYMLKEAQAAGWKNPASRPKGDSDAVPEANHLVTDLANAKRIHARYGTELIFAAGRPYVYTGTHWAPDEGAAHRRACALSNLILAEAADWAAKPTTSEEEKKLNAGIAEALRKWAKKSEMKSVIDAAYSMLRQLLNVDAAKLDADPWALNCLNGTIDLRTGAIRPHNPDDFITRVIRVDYDPAARALRFEQFVAEIFGEGSAEHRPLSQFTQRWFGYAATGSVQEQKLAVHYGLGANGKSTLVDAASGVLGDYASTAAPGLLTGSGERHPTEIADLHGRRMVTAHEPDEGAALREGFVKQATGGDVIKARFMRADFFEFHPTHKLQLLTNHRPQVKGQDFGIWRRVLLVPYGVQFGDAAAIAAGKATCLRDDTLADTLKAERPGILAWIVRGAIEWHTGGLRPPNRVLAAVEDYRREQDRVGQFVADCCELGPEFSAPVTDPGGTSIIDGEHAGGLYPAYQNWCKESGYMALGKVRYLAELERVVPHYRREDRKVLAASGKRRSSVYVWGLRV